MGPLRARDHWGTRKHGASESVGPLIVEGPESIGPQKTRGPIQHRMTESTELLKVWGFCSVRPLRARDHLKIEAPESTGPKKVCDL